MRKTAVISDCKKYRYCLGREWGKESDRKMVFVMLNPSVADADIDDPTIRKCMSIASNHGFERISVINLYAYRSTDPKALLSMGLIEATGPENLLYCQREIEEAGAIVVAWGKQGGKGTHRMRELLKGKGLLSLAVNKDGSPKHPLYCKTLSILSDYKLDAPIQIQHE